MPDTISPNPIFDPASYAPTRRPLTEAWTLPSWCYVDPAFHAAESREAFGKSWQLAGRADEIPNAGDYLTVDTVAGPIIVLRGNGGEVRAFANTCRHRGAQLIAGKGSCGASISCPYHGWTYGLDGALVGVPSMREAKGFDKSASGLIPIRLECWGGFMFFNPDPKAEPLLSYFGDLPEQLGCYKFDEMVCVKRSLYDVAANWKLIAENSMEDYHTGYVHKGSLGQQNSIDIETKGHWDAIHIEGKTSIAVLPGETTPFPHIPGLDERAQAGTYFTILHPNTQFACTQDCMWWMTMRPVAIDRTRLEVGFAFPRSIVARPDFAEVTERYFYRWGIGIPEDNQICEGQQGGLKSPLRAPGRFSHREHGVHKLNNWLVDQIVGGPRKIGG